MPLADLIRTFNRADGLAPPPGSSLNAELVIAGERAAARLAGLTLNSVFQPLVDLQKKRVVGHEALLRAATTEGPATAVTPGEVFDLPSGASDIVYVDRLTRTLHALNFLVQRRQVGGYLYLNVHPRHLTTPDTGDGLVFEAILKRCGLAPADIVLEIQESEIDDDVCLLEAVAGYRQRGYVIAIDNFGRRHSNLDRLWRLQPEIVKFDRSLIVAAAEDERAALVLAKLVEIVHALSAVTVAEGIETAAQLKAAHKAGTDLVQGHLLGRPDPGCVPTHRQDNVTYNLDLLATGASA